MATVLDLSSLRLGKAQWRKTVWSWPCRRALSLGACSLQEALESILRQGPGKPTIAQTDTLPLCGMRPPPTLRGPGLLTTDPKETHHAPHPTLTTPDPALARPCSRRCTSNRKRAGIDSLSFRGNASACLVDGTDRARRQAP